MFITAQIDLTQVGKLIRELADLAKKVQFKDGTHQLLNITISDRRGPDRNGNTINISCKPKNEQNDSKWFIGSGKEWQQNNASSPAPQQAQAAQQSQDGDLPF